MPAVPAYSSRWQNGASWVWKAWAYLDSYSASVYPPVNLGHAS